MTIRKHLGAAIIATALLIASSIAGAAQSTTTDATVTITSGTFTTTITGGAFGTWPYSFTTIEDLEAEFTVTATDPRGTGAGWNVQISAEDFTGLNVANTIDIDNLSLNNPVVEETAGGDDESTVTANSVTLSNDNQTLLSAEEDGGEGSYTVTYDGLLDIPGLTRADSYTSTITVAIDNGP